MDILQQVAVYFLRLVDEVGVGFTFYIPETRFSHWSFAAANEENEIVLPQIYGCSAYGWLLAGKWCRSIQRRLRAICVPWYIPQSARTLPKISWSEYSRISLLKSSCTTSSGFSMTIAFPCLSHQSEHFGVSVFPVNHDLCVVAVGVLSNSCLMRFAAAIPRGRLHRWFRYGWLLPVRMFQAVLHERGAAPWRYAAGRILRGWWWWGPSFQTFAFLSVVHNVSQAIERGALCQFLFCFLMAVVTPKQKPEPVYLYINHWLLFLNCSASHCFCSAMVMWLLSNKIASSAFLKGPTSRFWSI